MSSLLKYTTHQTERGLGNLPVYLVKKQTPLFFKLKHIFVGSKVPLHFQSNTKYSNIIQVIMNTLNCALGFNASCLEQIYQSNSILSVLDDVHFKWPERKKQMCVGQEGEKAGQVSRKAISSKA